MRIVRGNRARGMRVASTAFTARLLFHRRHGTPPATSKALSPRRKLCIPRVRGCTLPTNCLRNFTRPLSPFLRRERSRIHATCRSFLTRYPEPSVEKMPRKYIAKLIN
ncbi:hypothetical protein PUN28_000661 [Cardiocondyla obscurior]|uniref:Secreted protein n=1 Tax=Cardiocondyla obscurior TaxID=286306 RepID=A0AAW2H0H0_9HYME